MKTRPPLHTRAFFALALALLTAIPAFAGDTNQSATTPPDFTVKLRYGKEIALTPAAVQTLYSNAVKLLKSSSFNSSKSASYQMHWDASKIAADYRFTVAGSYLRVSFKKPQDFTTAGGAVSVREIVIALNEHFGDRSELFTIDDEGQVIEHGKYSGQVIVGLLKNAQKLASE